MTQVPTTGSLFGPYRIDERIGMGGMGVVYAATDTRLDRRVALKLVSGQLAGDPSFVARFQREAAVLARLDSPHIVAIFDHGDQDGTPYIATQYVGGGDLGALIGGRGALPPQLALRVCAQIAEALADAHRVGVIHRDVKPSNVLLRDPDAAELHAYLCDFGIAQTESEGLTTAGAIAGSWAYLAPERANGDVATAASDVYATGCLLWACLTGRAPYAGSDVEVAMAHVSAPVPQLPGDDAFVRDLNEVLNRSMAKDPAQRFASADDQRAAFAALADRAGGRATVQAPPPWRRSWTPGETDPGAVTRARSAGPRRRRTPLVAALALLLVAGLGLTAWLVLRDDDSGPAQLVRGITGDTDGDGHGDLRGYYLPDGYQDLTFASDGSSVDPAAEQEGPSGQRLHGDFDGDGLDDVLVLDDEELPRLNWTITYATGQTLDGDWQWKQPHDAQPIAVAGDFDSDDITDVALYANPSNTISQMRGKAPDAGEFRTYVAVSTKDGLDTDLSLWFTQDGWGRNDVRLVPGDFDGDTADDLAVVRQGSFSDPHRDDDLWELTFLKAGNLSFDAQEPALSRAGLSDAPWRLAPGDFDGDGTDELAFVADGDADAINLVRYSDSGFAVDGAPWGTVDHAEAVGLSDIAVSDLDGDGADDLAWFVPGGTDALTIRAAFADGGTFALREIGSWACSVSCDSGSLVGYYPED